MDKKEILLDVIDSIINKKDEEARAMFRTYMTDKSKEIISSPTNNTEVEKPTQG